MQVFLSWSGERSKAAAGALHELLPSILQPVTCWMSENDLPKGKPWFEELRKKLDSIVFAIVCATPENRDSQWLLWESGFLSSASGLGDRHIVPLAIGMEKGAIGGPLAIYQGADITRDEMFRLVRNINSALHEDRRVPGVALERTFQHVWASLEERLKAAVALTPAEPAKAQAQPDQQEEILALLRQQQREGADIKTLAERIDLNLKLFSLQIRSADKLAPSNLSGLGNLNLSALGNLGALNQINPEALNPDNIVRPGSGAIGLRGEYPNTTLALDERTKRPQNP